MDKTINFYNHNAGCFFRKYESVSAETLHSNLFSILDKTGGLLLDVGAGFGRDANWLRYMKYINILLMLLLWLP